MQFYKRLKKIRAWYNLNQNEMAHKINVSLQSIGNLENEAKEVKPKIDTLSKIIQAFPEISAKWLLTGEGEMLVKPQKTSMLMAEEGQSEYQPVNALHEYNNHLKEEVAWLRKIIEENLKTDISETEQPKQTKQTNNKSL